LPCGYWKYVFRKYVVDSLTNTDNGLGYTNGDGTNTLRKCIRLANTNAGSDTITFNVSGMINYVDSALPVITDNETIIDASSRWSGTWPVGSPGVTLNGTGLSVPGLSLGGVSNCAISGLFITGFGFGTYIYSGATSNFIGGTTAGARNVISGNRGHGVNINGSGTNNNHVSGNYIGTNADGTTALET